METHRDDYGWSNYSPVETSISAWGPIFPYVYGPVEETPATERCPRCTPPKKTGFNCKKCNEFNQYSEANQPDGSFLCSGCRRPKWA